MAFLKCVKFKNQVFGCDNILKRVEVWCYQDKRRKCGKLSNVWPLFGFREPLPVIERRGWG